MLLVEDGAGWALPETASDEPEIVVDVGPTLRDLVGQDLFVLRDIRFGSMPPPDDVIVYVTEPVIDPTAARGRWWTGEDLPRLDLGDPHDRAALEVWFQGHEPATLQPWQRNGWFRTAVTWIEEMLTGVSDVRQFATWCNSCILTVRSDRGRSWFKASPASFANEPEVMATLAALFPRRTPEVIALDAPRGWMLLEDLGNETADGLPVAERLGALAAIGELHRASVSLIDTLLDSGCTDRRPHLLSAQIAELAGDPTVPLPGDLGARFEAAVPRLQELCTRLATSSLPSTLVHGDLHAGNIIRTAGRFVVFDWSDACVADPFVDVLMFLTRLPDETELRARFLQHYLDPWPGVARSEAAAYAELAEPLAAMHHAVTYRGIYDVFGDDEWWLFEGALPRWIEHALACSIVRS